MTAGSALRSHACFGILCGGVYVADPGKAASLRAVKAAFGSGLIRSETLGHMKVVGGSISPLHGQQEKRENIFSGNAPMFVFQLFLLAVRLTSALNSALSPDLLVYVCTECTTTCSSS